MSLRQLPEIQVAPPSADISYDLSPRALESWNREVTAAAGDNVITIFDPIGETWDGRGVTVNRVSAALRAIGDKAVTVQINSPGGNFFDGLAIYNLLRLHPKAVTVQIVGIAASAASIIAQAGDEIEIGKAALLMIHNVQWLAIGDRHAMREAHDSMKVFDDALTGLYVDRTGMAVDSIAEMMDATTFMAGEEAIDMGFADKLLAGDTTVAPPRAANEKSPLYRLDAVLARAGISRGDRRKLIKEIAASKPGAAPETATPGAGEPAVDDGTAGLSVALARLRLARA